MSRYYSESDYAYTASRQPVDNVHASGWQKSFKSKQVKSPPPPTSASSAITRIVVQSPFGSKKSDYTIDKSQLGRLIVTARRRQNALSDYLSFHNKKNIATQTFTIPYDADVNRLKSHVDRHTNRLIIEIPRTSNVHSTKLYNSTFQSNDTSTSSSPSQLIYDKNKYRRQYFDNDRKLEYRVDCHGYDPDDLDVFIQGHNVVVQGKTERATSPGSSRRRILKKFSRKIELPNTVDTRNVVSYYSNGDLFIQAPLKHGIYYSNENLMSSGLRPTRISNRTAFKTNRVHSPYTNNHQRHYRRHEHISRHRLHDHNNDAWQLYPIRQVRSAEDIRFPIYSSSRDIHDYDNDYSQGGRHRRAVNYERYVTHHADSGRYHPVYRTTYSPLDRVVTTKTTTYHDYPTDRY